MGIETVRPDRAVSFANFLARNAWMVEGVTKQLAETRQELEKLGIGDPVKLQLEFAICKTKIEMLQEQLDFMKSCIDVANNLVE